MEFTIDGPIMDFTIREHGAGRKEFYKQIGSCCVDCEFFDTEAGNIYGVCIRDSYIDGDGEFHLEWISSQASPCSYFREIKPETC